MAIVLAALGFLAGQWLWPPLRPHPFLFAFPPVVIAATTLGGASGYLTTGLGAVLAYVALEQRDGASLTDPRDWLAVGLFAGFGVLSCALIHTLRRFRDRTEAAEHDKTLFLRETRHRFRNDLSIATALLSARARTIGDDRARAALSGTVDRILVIARIHDRLRVEAGSTAFADAKAVLADLCDDARTALADRRPIAIAIAAESGSLPHARALAVGLIANEALANAVDHAFPDGRAGLVTVSFARRAETFVLTVADDGIGFDPERMPAIAGLGHTLMRSMARQIGAELSIAHNEGGPGVNVTVAFPVLGP